MLHYSPLQRAPPENHCVLMAASLKLLPGSTVRWRGRRYLIVDYQSLDAIIARQPGKRRLERIPVNEAAPITLPLSFPAGHRTARKPHSQIALPRSHLFLHDQPVFADISGTDKRKAIADS